jgi:hypothetical protein
LYLAAIADFFQGQTHPSQTEHFWKWPKKTELSIAEHEQEMNIA